MNLARVAGLILIAAIVISFADLFVGPSGVHDAPNNAVRQAIIEANKGRWDTYFLIGVAASFLISLGVILFSANQWLHQSKALLLTASGSFVLAACLMGWYAGYGVGDVQVFVERHYAGSLWIAHTLATCVGGVTFGIALLRGGFPLWLGYLAVGASALLVTYAVFPSVYTYGIFLVFFLILMMIGIALVANLQSRLVT